MKKNLLAISCLVLFLITFGCGKKSGLEGKVVDEAGNPIPGLKIVASQVQPIKGYEQFDATTGSDGVFRFNKLFPASDYVLRPYPTDWSKGPAMSIIYEAGKAKGIFTKEGWLTEDRLKIRTGFEGQTMMLSSPVKVIPAFTTVTGKVTGNEGPPIAGVKITIRQTKPVKGYEQFETTTVEDGSYLFDKLLPQASYELRLEPGEYPLDNTPIIVECADVRQIKEMPIQLQRYYQSDEGVIWDTRTNLEWATGPDSDMDWHAANTWVSELIIAGGGWRMPRRSELKSLYQESLMKDYRIDSIFNLTVCCVWSGEMMDTSSAWHFHFNDGLELWNDLALNVDARAFAVRSKK